MAREISVEVLPQRDLDAWAKLLSTSPEGSIYSHPAYLDALCRAAGGRFSVAGVRQGEELVGGIAVYERSGRLGSTVAPRPLLYYNGPVLRRYATRYPSEQTGRHVAILGALARWLAGRGLARLTLRCRASLADARPFLEAGWSASPGYTYVVDIADPQATRSRVEQNLQRLARRCEREAMAFGEDDDFASFWRMHAGTVERKNFDCYLPEPAFGAFFGSLRAAGLCRLYHARLPDGRAVATQLVLLGPGRVAHTAAAGADPEFLRSGATAFLRLRVFEALAAQGYGACDLTDAALNPVTHFKSQLGGDLQLLLLLDAPRSRFVRAASGLAGLARRARAALRRPSPGSSGT